MGAGRAVAVVPRDSGVALPACSTRGRGQRGRRVGRRARVGGLVTEGRTEGGGSEGASLPLPADLRKNGDKDFGQG